MTKLSDEPAAVLDGPGRRPAIDQARAYCGTAHGQVWPVDRRHLPLWVELPVDVSTALYRLVLRPRTGRPARDQHGNYLYVPLLTDGEDLYPEARTVDDRHDARVIAFPAGGRRSRPRSTTDR
ncbi:hypothetical protein [Blastococcus sp. CCUG 61487]|uniref:hypothetical protein n=1 Tax=Blastococcus sp. CCUG 61487 TaxID=1840703 RepID=UPI0010C03B55|nr:hypothetical protein [Blastococcus sp. CCUG 61487]TKJ16856.1 hypothetical protein A6V29_12795 [Blastococcus sp. CCUG 61487]